MSEGRTDVIGYEGRYVVTRSGEVISLPGSGPGRYPTERVMRTFSTSDGYLRVSLSAGGRCKKFLVHCLVARAYSGQPPTHFHEVNHVDGVKTNNTPENLEWVTRSENIRHADRTGLRRCPRGDLNSCTKMTTGKSLRAVELLRDGVSVADVAQVFGVSRTTLLNARGRHGFSTSRNNFERLTR